MVQKAETRRLIKLAVSAVSYVTITLMAVTSVMLETYCADRRGFP